MILDERSAWEAARCFATTVTHRLGADARAVYAVGSLPQGAYRPGLSDIDLVLVLAGDGEIPDAEVEAARREAASAGETRIDVGCVILRETDLTPPFPPEREVAPEVLRLDDEGLRLTGDDVRPKIVRPKRSDLVAFIRHYDELVRQTVFCPDSGEDPSWRERHGLAAAACRHYIFVRENLLIWRKQDTLMAFSMGHPEHPWAPTVVELLRLGPAPETDTARVCARLPDLWCGLHQEILA